MDKKPGRPEIKISPKEIEQAKALAGYGLTNQQIATIIGISLASINNKPQLLDAIKLGKDLAAGNLHRTAYDLAVKDKNPAMIMFLLKCKHGFRERQDIDVTHRMEPIIITRPSDGSVIELSHAQKALKAKEGDE